MQQEAGPFTGFGEAALPFYEGLAVDNSRAYWQAHRAEWEEAVAEPMRDLAESLAPEFGEAKIFRPNRDLRFTTDKRPYKEAASMVVESGTGVLYLQLSLDGLMLAAGYYQPSREALARFRHLQDDPKAAAGLDRTLRKLERSGYPLGEGAPLRTAPRGWPRDHPRIGLIRRTSLTAGATHEPGPWLHGPACLDRVVTGWQTLTTWNRWLSTHIGPADA